MLLGEYEYEWMPGYPKEYCNNNKTVVEAKYRCAWSDRLELMKLLLGSWSGYDWQLPHKYVPQNNNQSIENLYATSCNIEPLGVTSTDTNYYQKAILNVTYEWQDYYWGTQPLPGGGVTEGQILYDERLEPSAEFITLNRKGLYWDTSNDKVPLASEDTETPAKLIKMLDWVLNFRHVVQLNYQHLDAIGKVNLTAVKPRSLGITFPAETLLCGNVSATREFIGAKGYPNYSAWAISYRFTYRNNGTYASPKGWNHFPRTDNADTTDGIKWEKVTNGADQLEIYTTMEFNTLFGL